MPRYKDTDEILKRLPNDLPYKASVKRVLMQAPDADVVEVVRCKDCKCYEKGSNESEGWEYCRRTGVNCNADDFCSYGERKEQ